MKNSLLMLSVCAIGLAGCLTEQPAAQLTGPETADGSSYCFVGMDWGGLWATWSPKVIKWLRVRSDVQDVFAIPAQGLVMIQSPPGESFSEKEAHTMCQECNGSMVAYGQLDLWDELKRAHAGEPSSHKVAKKAKKDQASKPSK